MTTPTRTEFEAAAYRWLVDPDTQSLPGHPNMYVFAQDNDSDALLTGKQADTAIAAAMGWPTVPEVKS